MVDEALLEMDLTTKNHNTNSFKHNGKLMLYHRLFIPCFLLLTQSVYSMELTPKEDKPKITSSFHRQLIRSEQTPKEELPKITSSFHNELVRTDTNISPTKKTHKKFNLNFLTRSDAEPHSSKIKTSPRNSLDIIEDKRTVSPSSSPREKHSPKKLDLNMTQDNSKTIYQSTGLIIERSSSPTKRETSHSSKKKTSPRTIDSIEDNRKISPRTFDITQEDFNPIAQSTGLIIERSPSPTKRNTESTHSSKVKISPRTIDISIENSSKISPRRFDTEPNNPSTTKISPREFDIIENNKTISPKSSPLKSPTRSKESLKTSRASNKLIMPDLPELPRSRSYNPHELDKEKNTDKKHKRAKSKSTGDRSVLLQRKKSEKDIYKENDTIITAGSYSPKEEKKSGIATTYLSKSDSMIENLTNPSQSKSVQKSFTHEKNTIINDSITPTKHREFSLGKFFSKSSGITENSSSPSPIKTTRPSFIDKTDIINTVRYEDLDTIKKCINNPDVNLNEQNELGMTALHYAALNKRHDIIELLLLNPSLDSTIKTYNKPRTASELIEGIDSCAKIRPLLFRRLTLDTVVMQETFIMLMKLYINNQLLNDKCIKETRESIKNKISTTESLQGGSELPKDALLNATDDFDANDDFIVDMINCRIPQDAKTTEHLISIIYKEIHALLFNVDVNNTMIYESVNAIQKNFDESSSPRKKSNKKSARINLPQYATYQFIFNVILSYIQEQKIIIKHIIEPSFAQMILQEEELAEIAPKKEEPDALVNQSSISSKMSNVSLQSSIEIKK